MQGPEAGEGGDVDTVQHVPDKNVAAPLTAFDSATDAQQKQQEQEEGVGISENVDDQAEPGADRKQLQSLPEETSVETGAVEVSWIWWRLHYP